MGIHPPTPQSQRGPFLFCVFSVLVGVSCLELGVLDWGVDLRAPGSGCGA